MNKRNITKLYIIYVLKMSVSYSFLISKRFILIFIKLLGKRR